MKIIDFLKTTRLSYILRGIRSQYLYNSLKRTDEFDLCLQNLKKYINIHKGERCFIVATGPSLTLDDLELLKGEFTISVNSIIKSFSSTDWRPTYYCVSDVNVWKTLHKDIEMADLNTVFYEATFGPYYNSNGVPLYHCSYPRHYELGGIGRQKFSNDMSKCIYAGSTVVFTALQIAASMGFKEIYLLGVDCNYNQNKQYSSLTNYKLKEPSAASQGKTNGSFATNMFSDFMCAKSYLDEMGISVINVTRGGMLEVFPRKKLEDVALTKGGQQ